MKKELLLLFALFISLPGLTQTYYYKCVERVDVETGIRSQTSGGMYITFTNNGCYMSDKDGYQKSSYFYEYMGTNKDMKVYESYEISQWTNIRSSNGKWIFSADFKRMNETRAFYFNKVYVYERANPEDIDVPDQMY